MVNSYVDIEIYFVKNQEKASVNPYTNFQDNDPCLVFSTYLFRGSLKEFETGNVSTNSVNITQRMLDMDKV